VLLSKAVSSVHVLFVCVFALGHLYNSFIKCIISVGKLKASKVLRRKDGRKPFWHPQILLINLDLVF
jgi:hypothetical protein